MLRHFACIFTSQPIVLRWNQARILSYSTWLGDACVHSLEISFVCLQRPQLRHLLKPQRHTSQRRARGGIPPQHMGYLPPLRSTSRPPSCHQQTRTNPHRCWHWHYMMTCWTKTSCQQISSQLMTWKRPRHHQRQSQKQRHLEPRLLPQQQQQQRWWRPRQRQRRLHVNWHRSLRWYPRLWRQSFPPTHWRSYQQVSRLRRQLRLQRQWCRHILIR